MRHELCNVQITFFLKVNRKLGRLAEKLIGHLDCPNSYGYYWSDNIWDGYLDNADPPIFGQSTNQISTVCNPDFLDSADWNCTENADGGYCDDDAYGYLYYAVEHDHGYQTVLNCPECGCNGTPRPIPPYDENEARSAKNRRPK